MVFYLLRCLPCPFSTTGIQRVEVRPDTGEEVVRHCPDCDAGPAHGVPRLSGTRPPGHTVGGPDLEAAGREAHPVAFRHARRDRPGYAREHGRIRSGKAEPEPRHRGRIFLGQPSVVDRKTGTERKGENLRDELKSG